MKKTGTNNVPLGIPSFRRRARSPPPTEPRTDLSSTGSVGERKRVRKSRWNRDEEPAKESTPSITSISGNMTQDQIEAYAISLRIEEVSRILRLSDAEILATFDDDRGRRSPSPPPQYDSNGKRINTREHRARRKLEDERHKLVQKALKLIPGYRPPADYKRPAKTQEKIYIPVHDYPEINFIGLIIGPRGNTLKKMEQESGAKIAVRGKGSVKEGKGRSDISHQSTMNEDLHCLIIADDEEKIMKAAKMVNHIIETAASVPEGQNDLKRGQLRELAALNGTLRDDESLLCQNCGEAGHKKYDCPQRRNYTASIICRICGNAGHFARDCKENPRNNGTYPAQGQISSVADQEYQQLMAELNGDPVNSNLPPTQEPLKIEDSHRPSAQNSLPPWRKNAAVSSPQPSDQGTLPVPVPLPSAPSLPPWRSAARDTRSGYQSGTSDHSNNYNSSRYPSRPTSGAPNHARDYSETNSRNQSSQDLPPWRQQATQGNSGHSGHSGYSGHSGNSGNSGYSGYSGHSGHSGYAERSGHTGYAERSGPQFNNTNPSANLNTSSNDTYVSTGSRRPNSLAPPGVSDRPPGAQRHFTPGTNAPPPPPPKARLGPPPGGKIPPPPPPGPKVNGRDVRS